MRNILLGTLVGVGIGVALGLYLHTAPDSPKSAPNREPARPAAGARSSPSATLAGSPRQDETVHDRLTAIEAELHRVTAALEALRESPSRTATQNGAAENGVRATDSVETIRRAWSEILDGFEERLRPHAPRDGSVDPVYESRLMDIRESRGLLQEAETIDDLRRLSKANPNIFKFVD